MASASPTQPIVRTARDAADLCAPYLEGCAHEKLVVLHLDAERRLLKLWVEQAGIAHGAFPIRAIIADAIRYNSAGLVLAHCHSGDGAKPRATDLAATRKLAQSAAALGIALHDHLVFAGGECSSFRTLGLI